MTGRTRLACTPFPARWRTRSLATKAVSPGLWVPRSASANAKSCRQARKHADKAFRSGDSECKTALKRRSDANRGVFCVKGFSLARALPRRVNRPLCGRTTTCFTKPPSRRILTIVQAVKNPRRKGGVRLWPTKPTAFRTRSGCASTTSCSRRSIGERPSHSRCLSVSVKTTA